MSSQQADTSYNKIGCSFGFIRLTFQKKLHLEKIFFLMNEMEFYFVQKNFFSCLIRLKAHQRKQQFF